MELNLDKLLTQKDTGQSELEDKILTEAMRYPKKSDQLFVMLYRMMGCQKVPKESSEMNNEIFKDCF